METKGLIFERTGDKQRVVVVDGGVHSHGPRLGSPKGAMDFLQVAYLMPTHGVPSGRRGYVRLDKLTGGEDWTLIGRFEGEL